MKTWGEWGFLLAAGLGILCFLGAACRSGEKAPRSEFDRFLDDDRNRKLLSCLDKEG